MCVYYVRMRIEQARVLCARICLLQVCALYARMRILRVSILYCLISRWYAAPGVIHALPWSRCLTLRGCRLKRVQEQEAKEHHDQLERCSMRVQAQKQLALERDHERHCQHVREREHSQRLVEGLQSDKTSLMRDNQELQEARSSLECQLATLQAAEVEARQNVEEKTAQVAALQDAVERLTAAGARMKSVHNGMQLKAVMMAKDVAGELGKVATALDHELGCYTGLARQQHALHENLEQAQRDLATRTGQLEENAVRLARQVEFRED